MDWAADDRSHLDTLVELEARVNDVWRRHDDAAICVGVPARFSRNVVIDMIRTHPMVIIGGIPQENPFYLPPETFLRDYRQHREGRGPSRTPARPPTSTGGR